MIYVGIWKSVMSKGRYKGIEEVKITTAGKKLNITPKIIHYIAEKYFKF
jgi:hypothetical protein